MIKLKIQKYINSTYKGEKIKGFYSDKDEVYINWNYIGEYKYNLESWDYILCNFQDNKDLQINK